MPFARIGLTKDSPAGRFRIISKAACGAMIETANVPVSDKVEIDGLGAFVNPIAGQV